MPKIGDMLKAIESESHKGKVLLQPDAALTPKQTARETAGISRSMADRCQQLASIPEKEFYEALNDPSKKPSRDGIIKKLNVLNDYGRAEIFIDKTFKS